MARAWDLSSRRTSAGVRYVPGSKPLTRHTSAAVPGGSRSSENTSADGRAAHRFSHSSPALFPAGVFTPAPVTATGAGPGDVTTAASLDGPVAGDLQLRRGRVIGLVSQPGGEEPQPGSFLAERLAGQRAGQRMRKRLQHVAGEGRQARVRRDNGQDVLQRHVVAGHWRAGLEGRRITEAGP